jgi:hypothetical protein
VGPRGGLDVAEKREILPLPRFEPLMFSPFRLIFYIRFGSNYFFHLQCAIEKRSNRMLAACMSACAAYSSSLNMKTTRSAETLKVQRSTSD